MADARALAAMVGVGVAAVLAPPAGAAEWVAAWGAPQDGSGSGGPSNATVRNIVRVTLGGARLRIRLSNTLSNSTPLVVGAAGVGVQQGNPSSELVPGSVRRITFGGKPGVTLAPGTQAVYSDPVDLPVKAQQNVAVSLHLSGAEEPGASTTQWATSYATADGAGDHTGDEAGVGFSASAFPTTTPAPLVCSSCGTYALTAVDVLTDQANGAVIGLGSSTFHGYNSTPNGWDRVLDVVSERINRELPSGGRKGVVSMGIGGDTLHAGLERFNRDVYSQSAVTGVIPYDINDIAMGSTAEQVEADYRKLIADSHRRGIRVFCGTWAPESTYLAPTPTRERRKLNEWLLTSGACDDEVDWDAVLSDPDATETYKPEFTAGSDTIHPNSAGHRAMAEALPLRWFTLPNLRPGTSGPGTASCLARRSSIGPRGIGRVRLGLTRRALLRRVPAPRRSGARYWRWCVKHSRGTVTAVFTRRGRVALVASTSAGYGNRGVHPGARASRLRRAYRRRRGVGRGLFRAGPRSSRLIGVSRGRVRYVGVASPALLRSRAALRAHLRLAGLGGKR